MEKIINGEKVEIYELGDEKQVRLKNGRSMSLSIFEKLLALNPKFYELSDDDLTKLLMQIFPGGIWSK